MLPQHNKTDLLPSSFQDRNSFKTYTSEIFIEKFREFIAEVSNSSNFLGAEVLERQDKDNLMELAKSVVDTRGIGKEAWMILQSFRQCFKGNETPELLDTIATVATAYYAMFASYETLDDLPALDNAAERRAAPAIWKKYGEETAILFAKMLSAFSNHLINSTSLNSDTKFRLLSDLDGADILTLYGASIHLEKEELKRPDAIYTALKSHELKSACLSSAIMGAGAILASADEQAISKMQELGNVLGHIGQIINDAHPKDIIHDIKTSSPNIIVAAAGSDDIQKGVMRTQKLFSDYEKQAQKILDNFDSPNIHLIEGLDDAVKRFNAKIALAQEPRWRQLLNRTKQEAEQGRHR